jgi:hypothetical protein
MDRQQPLYLQPSFSLKQGNQCESRTSTSAEVYRFLTLLQGGNKRKNGDSQKYHSRLIDPNLVMNNCLLQAPIRFSSLPAQKKKNQIPFPD